MGDFLHKKSPQNDYVFCFVYETEDNCMPSIRSIPDRDETLGSRDGTTDAFVLTDAEVDGGTTGKPDERATGWLEPAVDGWINSDDEFALRFCDAS